MKKCYEKPMLVCEHLHPEEALCGCLIKNPSVNEEAQCGYEPPGLGFKLFAQNWVDCMVNNSDISNSYYCYHSGTVNLFGS